MGADASSAHELELAIDGADRSPKVDEAIRLHPSFVCDYFAGVAAVLSRTPATKATMAASSHSIRQYWTI
jgi:hypothetical protein